MIQYYIKSLIGIGILGILNSCGSDSILEIKHDDEGIDIVYKNSSRLIGLKAYKTLDSKATSEYIDARIDGNFVIINLNSNGISQENPKDFRGSFFKDMPDFEEGVTLWRYKPWNSWTKPILISSPSEIKDWDVQFFYWQYKDGVYGAAMPLSGEGYRTTLGNNNGRFGAKSVRYGPGASHDKTPQMVIGFGDDPFRLFKGLYQVGLTEMGATENLVENKTFPEKLDYIGWCTWNASENGQLLSEKLIVESVKTFTENDFPLGYVIVDDGWFDATKGMLNSFHPDKTKFPNGFKSLNDTLRNHFGIKEIGVWHAFNGYWNGINPDSELGERYKEELFSWQQKPSPVAHDSLGVVTYYFIKPESDSLLSFYRSMHEKLRNQGFSFLKVDNQLVVEKMAVNNYPIFSLSKKMHKALYQSSNEYFNGAVINCMDMTAEAYLNFGSSAVARAVEDYFPEDEGGIGYKMEKGNAAAHLVMAFYNSLYFQQMVFPDFDMFESHNTNAEFHAIARAINNGPVYVTDKPGHQNFEILRELCYSDGRLIRSSKPLTPTKDCLFVLQNPQLFKAFSMDGSVGLLGAWNLSDNELVEGTISPSDIADIKGDRFIIYEYFSQKTWEVSKNDKINVELPRMGYKLFYVLPAEHDAVAIGLINKYNAPATILSQNLGKDKFQVTVADFGKFAAVIPKEPKSVLCDGKQMDFNYKNKLLTVEILREQTRRNHKIEIEWE